MARRDGTEQLRFTHLHLENWRNFSRIDAELSARVFLVGPNAAGKSNLLDVFRFLHDVVAIGGGLQAAVEQKPRDGVSSRCEASRPGTPLTSSSASESGPRLDPGDGSTSCASPRMASDTGRASRRSGSQGTVFLAAKLAAHLRGRYPHVAVRLQHGKV